jgi:hypothetical protein
MPLLVCSSLAQRSRPIQRSGTCLRIEMVAQDLELMNDQQTGQARRRAGQAGACPERGTDPR